MADCAPLALRSGRRIVVRAGAEPAEVVGSLGGLRSTFANLIDNAIRAELPNGTVEVTLRTGGEWIDVDVRDHGAGVPPEDRERVFQPFWRKDERTAGSGLGLSIVREIVAAHGGRVEVTAPPSGPGALFRIRLPRATGDAVSTGLDHR